MKKRRVLALFLALSMALSSNGFTALAAEQDSVAAIEAGLSEGTDDTDGENITLDTNDENDNNASESEDGAQDNTGEDGAASEGESDVSEGGNGETGGGVSSENNGEAESNDAAPDGNSEAGDGVSSEDDGENESDVDASEEDVLGDAESENDLQVVDNVLENAGSAEVRMFTFTDETGMSVTYNLNEKINYNYTVTDHVLTSVKKVNADGTEEAITGVVELEQKTSDTGDAQYYTTIAASVFSNNKNITYVIIPRGVTTIGDDAFKDCTELKGISLPVSLTSIGNNAFKSCTKLIQLSIPKAVTSIGSSAFEDDSSLYMVYIKDYEYSSMASIGEAAFKNCRKLEKFGSDSDFVLPGYLETIGNSAFEECRSIKTVTLPNSLKDQKNQDGSILVKGLGEGAFKNCIGITDLVLSGVEIISKEAFSGCSNLLSVKFASRNKVIEESAFENCSVLSEVRFSSSVSKIGKKAFYGCTKLLYIDIPYPQVEIDAEAFPTNHEIWLRGFREEENGLGIYLKDRDNIKYIGYSDTTTALFKYEYHCLTTVTADKVTFTGSDKSTVISANGVAAGTRIYVGIITSTNVRLKAGSLRCNGIPVGKDKDGEYTFTMPVGGAYVTAEYERTGKDESKNILGNAEDVDFGLSNGTEIKSEEDKYSKTYELKVGQSTKMFLIDTSSSAENSVIDPSKITFTTKDSTIATVSADGTIKAVKRGTTVITAKVSDRNNVTTSRQVLIRISSADVTSLRLKPISYDTSIIAVDKDSNTGEITGISLRKNDVESNGTEFTLTATAYDKDKDNMSVALKWSSSDSRVAKLANSSTKEAESKNVITIPRGASGNATITVTATNKDPIEAEKQVVSKFVVSVRDNTPRLSKSSLTINPYQDSGAALDIIGAYNNKDIGSAEVYLRETSDPNVQSDDFRIYKDDTVGGSSYVRYNIKAVNESIKDGVYNVSVHIKVSGNEYYQPLTINVKKFQPNPKVTFARNQAKINLFYKNDGTEVVPVVSNLGNAKIESYSLENLSNNANSDDVHFAGNGGTITGNFQIDPETGVITRSDDDMYYTSKKKPVVTGKLVLTFEDYKEDYSKKEYKITIPTVTTKPVYKLSRTSDIFSIVAGKQEGVTLELLDNKKNPVNLNDGETEDYWTVEMDSTSTSTAVESNTVRITDDGKISMDFQPNVNTVTGTVVFAISNSAWDGSQVLKYKYTAKVSPKGPTFKLSKATISMNKHFKGYKETVTIIPNQYGVQVENPICDILNKDRLKEAQKAQYDMISVDVDDNKIEVAVNDSAIKNGTYRYVVYPYGESGSKLILNVRVIGTVPTVAVRGSATLNKSADTADKAILTLNPRNCPSDSTVDNVEIKCINNEGAEEHFDFDILEGNKLKISLKDSTRVDNKTYTFSMTPSISGSDMANPVRFSVRVYSRIVTVSLRAKGKINLLERNDGSSNGGNITPDPTPDPVTTKTVAVKYEHDSAQIDSVKIQSGEGAAKDITENDTAVIDNDNKKLKEKLVITATANAEYKITSIKAYNTGDKGVAGWTGATAIASESVGGEGATATLTIPADSTLTDAGITIVIESEKKAPVQPTEYVVTLTKPDGVGTLEYAAVNVNDTVDANTSINTPYSESAKIKVDTGKKLAIKVTPSTGYEILSVTAGMSEGEEQTSLNITKVAGLENVYETDAITSDVTINIEVKRIDYTITITDSTSEVVKKVEYKIGTDADTEYSEYSDTSKPKAKYGEKLELRLTVDKTKLSTGEQVVVKYTEGTDGTPEKLQLQETEPDTGDAIYNCDIAAVTGNIQISILTETSTEEVVKTNTARFIKKGSHAKIKRSGDADAGEINNGGTDSFEGGKDYTFVVNTDDGYDVDVKVYKKDEYDTASAENKLPDSEIECTKEASAYTISKDNIGDTTDIVIVVTDIYTITITNNADTAISAVQYTIGKAEEFADYDPGKKLTVSYGAAFSFMLTLASDASVVVRSGDAAMSPDADSQDGKPVYSIESIENNVVITISPKEEDNTEDKGDTEDKGNTEDGQENSNNNSAVQVNYNSKLTTYADDGDVPSYDYTVKNSIVYTPVVSNLKDDIIDARIFDDFGSLPSLSGDREDDSKYFNIDVIDGLLYVTPKPDVEEERIYLDNNSSYPLRIWLKFENYQPDPTLHEGGIWVNKGVTIRTAQILPNVTTDTNTINLYQSNPGYTATFVVKLKEGSVGKFKEEDAVVFGDRDEKAKDSLECETEVQEDGSLRVTISLKDGALYATNSTNKVKMYIQYENQAHNTLTTGTAITMNVRVNG